MAHTSSKGSYDAAIRCGCWTISPRVRTPISQAVQDQIAAENLACPLEVVEGSILDQQLLATAMHGIEYVFHKAALASVAIFPAGAVAEQSGEC